MNKPFELFPDSLFEKNGKPDWQKWLEYTDECLKKAGYKRQVGTIHGCDFTYYLKVNFDEYVIFYNIDFYDFRKYVSIDPHAERIGFCFRIEFLKPVAKDREALQVLYTFKIAQYLSLKQYETIAKEICPKILKTCAQFM